MSLHQVKCIRYVNQDVIAVDTLNNLVNGSCSFCIFMIFLLNSQVHLIWREPCWWNAKSCGINVAQKVNDGFLGCFVGRIMQKFKHCKCIDFNKTCLIVHTLVFLFWWKLKSFKYANPLLLLEILQLNYLVLRYWKHFFMFITSHHFL